MNSYHQTITFTTERSMDSISYLGVLVSRNGRVFETDLFCKPTDIHQYLQKNSVTHGVSKMPFHKDRLLGLEAVYSDKTFRMRLEN